MTIGNVRLAPTPLFLVLALSLVTMTGCSSMRRVEQWKCDNWGMCHFGTKPSKCSTEIPCPPDACATETWSTNAIVTSDPTGAAFTVGPSAGSEVIIDSGPQSNVISGPAIDPGVIVDEGSTFQDEPPFSTSP